MVVLLSSFLLTAVRCIEWNLDGNTSRIAWVLKGRIISVAELDVALALALKMCLLSIFVATDKVLCSPLHACLPTTEV